MSQATRKRDGIVSPRTCLIALLVNLLIFPPWMFGDPISWTGGGDGATYGDAANWSTGNVPNGLNYDVSIESSGPFNTSVTLDDIEQGIDAVSVNSMSIRGQAGGAGGSDDPETTATLNVLGSQSGLPDLTIGNPASTQGHALYVGYDGNLNISNGATVALELSGGGGSLYPGAANSVGAHIGYGGAVNIDGFSVLEAQNSFGGTRVLTNNGTINIGQGGDPAAIVFANTSTGQSLPTTFVLSGSGALTMSGGEAIISGITGTENLVNDVNHTITGSGVIDGGEFRLGFAGGLASFTNNGALTAANTGSGEMLVLAPLTNYNSSTGTVTNGSYNVQAGSALALANVPAIQSLNLANVQLIDDGIITNVNQNGPTGTNSLAGLSQVTDGTVDLQGVGSSPTSPFTIAPSNPSNTLTLRSDPLGLPTNLTVEQDSNGNASYVQIAGNLNNESKVYGAYEPSGPQTFGAVNGNAGTTIYTGGSNVNVSGSSLEVTGNLNNRSYGTPESSGLSNYQEAYSNINVMNGGSLTVDGNLTTNTNSQGNSTISLYGSDDNHNPVGASLTVNGNLRNGGGFGTPMSQGADNIYLENGNLTVNGNFTNNNAGYLSFVGLGNSTATVSGWFGQFQGNSSESGSILDLEDGSQMTVGNLRNSTGAVNSGSLSFQPQSNIVINGGSTLTIQNTFANVDANGVLSGGSYSIGGGVAGPSGGSGPSGPTLISTLSYNGPSNITQIAANTSLTFDDQDSGITGQILNGGNDALSPSLQTVNGALSLYDGATLNLTNANGLTIGASGQINAQGYGALSATGLTNNGSLTIFNYNGENGSGGLVDVTNNGAGVLGNLTGGVLTGGTWNLAGELAYGQGTDGSQGITQFSGVNMTLGGGGGIGYGAYSGVTTDALATLGTMTGSSLTLNDSSRTFGGNGSPFAIDSGSTLTANNSNISFSSSPTGTLNVTNSSTLALNGASANSPNGTTLATLDLSNGSGAYIDGNSNITVNDGATLSLTGGTSQTPGIVTDNGAININGTSSAGVLSVSDGGSYHVNGTGNVTLSGLGQIDVSSGNLLVSANLTNWTPAGGGGAGILAGGTYIVGNGSTLTLQSIGAGNSIQTLAGGATISMSGTGILTSDGTTNALSGLSTLTGSTLNLRSGANLALSGDFGSSGGNVAITNGSSLSVAGNFGNVQLLSGAENLTGGNFEIGSNSSLTYTGADINAIDTNTTLTLGNREGGATGTILNTTGDPHDALSNSLNTVNGAFNLQNGAQFTLGAAAGSFQNNGSIGVTNGSTLDVSAVGSHFTNVDGGGNLTGTFLIGGNSALNYNGADITSIGTLGTYGQLTLDGGNGQNTGTVQNANNGDPTQGFHDALSATLDSVTGTLNVQNGSTLALTGGQGVFNIDTNFGAVNVTNGSTLDVSAVGSGFGNVDSNGTLTGSSILIGTNSALKYDGADITAINGNLTLDNSGFVNTGSIQNGDPTQGYHDALSNTLTSINGTLNLTNEADLELSQALTVNFGGALNVDQSGSGGSGLTVEGKLTNYNATTSVGGAGRQSGLAAGGLANVSDDNNSDAYGQSIVQMANASTSIGGNLFNGAFTPNGGSADAEFNLGSGSGTTVGGDLKNLALFGATGPTSSVANLNLTNGASLSVTGNVQNIAAKGQFDQNYWTPTSQASINLSNGSEMQVNGTLKNYSGGGGFYGGSQASVNLNDASSLSVGGLITNSGGSVISLDNDYNGGSFLDAEGGVKNYNSSVFLNFNSQMQVAGGFQNLSDDSANGAGNGYSCLAVGTYSCSGGVDKINPQNSNVRINSESNSEWPSSATITGGLLNSASTSNGQYAESDVMVASGSFLNVDNLTNSAMAATPGQYDYATAVLTLGRNFSYGGTLNVTGNLTNTASVPLFQNGSSLGNANALIQSFGGSLTVGGSLTNSAANNANGGASAEIDLYYGSTTTVKGAFTNTAGSLYMDGGSTATIAGMFTNDSNSVVSLQNNQIQVNPQLSAPGTTILSNDQGQATTLNVTGEFDNTGSVSIGNATSLNVLEDTNEDPSAYNQTEGTTTLTVGGTLSADNVNITGGQLDGFNDDSGLTTASVVGNLTIGDDPAQTSTQATLDLGDPMTLDVTGNYDQTELGILDLSLEGPGSNGTFLGSDDSNNAYDQIDVTGGITGLDGTLNIENAGDAGFGSTFVQGDYFNILNWTGTDASANACIGSGDLGCFGTFNNVTFTDANGQLDTFIEQINAGDQGTELDLVVTAESATPEPGTLSMLFCAMLIGGGVTWYRRRRKNVAQ